MIKYIHIGYPKNFSTTLQRDYFSKHDSIFHLGVGVESNVGYSSSFVEKLCEVYLKTCKHYKYKEVEDSLLSNFNDLIKKIDAKFISTGISLEHFSFSFSYDSLSTQEKAERLYSLFGDNTRIIMIVRNQFDLIKSIYKEYVRIGFSGNFMNFMELSFKYQDRNFVYDFKFDKVFNTYAELFGKNNIGVFFFENYKKKDGTIMFNNNNFKLFDDLSEFLSIGNIKLKLNHFNEAMPSDKVLVNAKINEYMKHNFGNHLLEISEKHRISKYLEEDLKLFLPEKYIYEDVLTKREVIKEVLSNSQSIPLLFKADKDVVKYFKSFYESSNKIFEDQLGIKIPNNYHNLKM